MRAQFALLEAFVSAAALISCMYAVSAIYYNSSQQGTSQINSADMYYDFVSAFMQNAKYQTCLMQGNATCVDTSLEIMASAYAAGYVSIAYANMTFSYGNKDGCDKSSAECTSAGFLGNSTGLCLYSCFT
jgi:hypothetical protein